MTNTLHCTRGCIRWDKHLTDCPATDDQPCKGCEPRPVETGYLCTRCLDQLHTLLGTPDDRESIAGAYLWLSDNLGQHIRHSTGGKPSGDGSTHGEHMVTVMAAMTDLQVSFAEFAEEFTDSRSMRLGTDHAPAAVAARLRPWLTALADWEPIGDQIDHLQTLIGQAHGVVPWRTQDRKCDGVPCPTCRRKTLVIPAGEVDVWCQVCGAVHGRETYDRITALVAWEAQAEQRIQAADLGDGDTDTLERLAAVLDVPWGTLRRWKSLGWLPSPVGQQGRAEVYDARDLAVVVARIRGAAA